MHASEFTIDKNIINHLIQYFKQTIDYCPYLRVYSSHEEKPAHPTLYAADSSVCFCAA